MSYTLVPTELIVDGAITSAKLDTNIAISGTLGVTGEVTLATHLIMGDNDKIKIGTGGDLEIYHDGSNSYISNSTGNIYLGDTNGAVHIQAKLNEESIVASADGAVTLYHDNSAKLATASGGVTVTGTLTATTLAGTLSTAAQTNITSLGTLTGLTGGTGDLNWDSGTLFVDSSANAVGIGTTTVNAPLHLGAASPHIDIGPASGNRGKVGFDSNNVYIGSSSGTGEIHFKNNIGSTDAPHSSGDTKMVISDAGVGIGEISPETSLHIKNAGNSFLTLERSGTTGGTGKFGINMEGGSSQQTTMGYDDGGKLVIGRSSDPATMAGFSNDFVLNSSGRVGINELSPSKLLHVTSNTDYEGIQIKGSGHKQLKIESTSGGRQVLVTFESDSQNMSIGLDTDNDFIFHSGTAGAERMCINSSGQLLINRTSATGGSLLQVDGFGPITDGVVAFYDTDTSARENAVILKLAFSADSTVLDDAQFISFSDLGGARGSVAKSGSGVAFNTTSDGRLKDVTGKAKGLEVINKLNPVSYNWKDSGQADEGLIAQEVLDIVPNAVSGSEDNMYQMDYSKLVTPLIKAIQEQQTVIEELKSRIETLEG